MKTPQQWFEEMEARPCVTKNDLLAIIKRIQDDARREPIHAPEWLSQALNEGDGTYKP